MTVDRSAIVPGYRLPEFVRVTGFDNWNRYAAVNSEFVPIHMDDTAGQAAGYSGAIGMGNLVIAWFHAMFRAWHGGEGKLVNFNGQFRSPQLKGDTVTISAVVSSVSEHDGKTRVEFELDAQNQRGEKMMPGKAIIDLA
ncbi:MAG: MaoC family dehydratase [Acidimicrobiia bacterium]